MKLLLDTSCADLLNRRAAYPDLICGQLLTPLTQYSRWDGVWACDNGAFSRFDANAFLRLLRRNQDWRDACIFVAAPDVVGSARRTLEVFERWYPMLTPWPVALVAQDGIEDLRIPWELLAAIFIGGSTEWKMSRAAADVVKAARLMDVHIHVGRINTPRRWKHFCDLGADTCDGSGVARFDWMLAKIASCDFEDRPLFDMAAGEEIWCERDRRD